MITFVKGVTSSYVPLGGVLVDDRIGQRFHERGYKLGQTFAGHPIACAVVRAAIEEYTDCIIENVRKHSAYLEERLRELATIHDVIKTVRGRGFLWSVVFADPETGEPLVHPWVEDTADNPVEDVRETAKAHGVLFGGGGRIFKSSFRRPSVSAGRKSTKRSIPSTRRSGRFCELPPPYRETDSDLSPIGTMRLAPCLPQERGLTRGGTAERHSVNVPLV